MDPISHALVGVAVGGAVAGPRHARLGALVGALAGAVPDLDLLLTAVAPASLPNFYHRTYTHALLVAPVWGLLAALPCTRPAGGRGGARLVLGATLAALAHALMDAATAYGTALGLPFTSTRFAWNVLSMFDPVVGGLALVTAIALLARGRPRPARLGVALLATYILMLVIQHQRAATHQMTLTAQRHHMMQDAALVPVSGTPFVWRSVYAAENELHVDVFVDPPFARGCWHEGPSLTRFGRAALPEDEAVRRAFRGFSSFRQGFAARDPQRRTRIGDARFSLDPTGFAPLWGIRVARGPDGRRPQWFQVPAGRRLAAVPRGWRLWFAACPNPAMKPIIGP